VHVTGSDAVGWLVRLDRGEVAFEVAPRRGRPAFVVQAGETQVTVVGTRFTVVRDGSAARVSVLEGHVQVDSTGSHVMLAPGDSWPPATTLDELPELDDTPSEPPVKRHGTKRRAPARSAAGERFEKAARLEATDPEAALGIYRKLVRGRGRWAANALYAEARLELERGRRERSRELLQRYLVRYPAGANGSDVRTLLERLDAGSSAP
jgi:transmembrane sensor